MFRSSICTYVFVYVVCEISDSNVQDDLRISSTLSWKWLGLNPTPVSSCRRGAGVRIPLPKFVVAKWLTPTNLQGRSSGPYF